MPKIAIKRKFTLVGSMASFKILVNNNQIGKINNGSSQSFDINETGQLVIQIQWVGPGKDSPELILDNVQSDDTISLLCRAKNGIFLNTISLQQLDE